MLSRAEQLEFCKFCKNRKFEMQQGIICGLTEKKAVFKYTCKDFSEDNLAIHREQVFREEVRLKNRPKDFTFGLDKMGIKNGIVAGSILIVISLTWIIVAYSANLIFWYSYVVLVMGIISLIAGIVNSLIRAKLDRDHKNDNSIKSSEDILDL
jgi:hypothetical protein